uniref:Protein kinase domain-containing protein n=1 Tax=Pithovirus LCDPAC02 TaxID=2506601 RepID=A0A481YQC2_9VIRU|nr:MAG: hypothetical protein LCDPAC02_03590 [Pithovirus LCDPAC02]
MKTQSLSLPEFMLDEYNNRFNKIKKDYTDNDFRFDIGNVIECKNDENLFELIGYYIFKIFQNQQQDKLTEIKSSFENNDDISYFLYSFKLLNDENFKSKHSFEVFVKEFINDHGIDLKLNHMEFLREYFVGMKISELRDEVPGFVFTYFYIDEKEIREIIDKKYTNNLYIDKSKYGNILMFIEKVGDLTFGKYIDDDLLQKEDVINIYLQVILSLNAINQYYDFSHNDLHLDNIMITELEEPKILTYNVKLNGKQVKINLKVDKYLAKIIDFGMSSIKYQYKGEEVLSYNIFSLDDDEYSKEDYLFFPKEPFPENDIAKFSSGLGNIYRNKNPKISEMFINIVNYAVNDFNDYINNINFYMYYSDWNNKTYDEILNNIFEIFKDYIENPIFDKEKLVKCNSYLIRGIKYKIKKNEDLNEITKYNYLQNIMSRYVETGFLDFNHDIIYYRLPYSFKYSIFNKYSHDLYTMIKIFDRIETNCKILDFHDCENNLNILIRLISKSLYFILKEKSNYDDEYTNEFLDKLIIFLKIAINKFDFRYKYIYNKEIIDIIRNNIEKYYDKSDDLLQLLALFNMIR